MSDYDKIMNYMMDSGFTVKKINDDETHAKLKISSFEKASWYKETLDDMGFSIHREEIKSTLDPEQDFESFLKQSLMKSSGKFDHGYNFHMVIKQDNNEVFRSKPIKEEDMFELNKLLFNIVRRTKG